MSIVYPIILCTLQHTKQTNIMNEDMNDLKTWEQAKDLVHDASGMDNPMDYLWHIPKNSITTVLYPAGKLETYEFNGNVHVMYTIDNVLYEGVVTLKTGEHGGDTFEIVDFVEWDNYNGNVLSDECTQQIEEFLDANFVDYITEAETL